MDSIQGSKLDFTYMVIHMYVENNIVTYPEQSTNTAPLIKEMSGDSLSVIIPAHSTNKAIFIPKA
jgi:hypothetical protein